MSSTLPALELETQERAMQRKLLFEGTTNADTRILKFVNTFCSWCNSSSSDKKTNTSYFMNMRQSLDRMEFDAKRSYSSILTVEKLKIEYSSLQDKIKDEIFITKHHIAKHRRLNEEMQTAKNERIQYEHLLSLVRSKPDRKAVEFKVGKLKEEVTAMKAQLAVVDNAMATRKKQLMAMMQMAQDLSNFLKENDDGVLATISEWHTCLPGNVGSEQNKNDSEILQGSLESVSESNSIIQNCVEIQSDEEMQDLGASQYILQIKEPAPDVETSKTETLFLIEADSSFDDLLQPNLPEVETMKSDESESPEKSCKKNIQFSSFESDESYRCSYKTDD